MTPHNELFLRLFWALGLIVVIYKILHTLIKRIIIRKLNKELISSELSQIEELIKQKKIEMEKQLNVKESTNESS